MSTRTALGRYPRAAVAAALCLVPVLAGTGHAEEVSDAPTSFELPAPAQPGGLVAPAAEPIEGYLADPLPANGRLAPPVGATGILDSAGFELGGLRGGLETGEGTPGLFATVGAGPISSRAGVVKDPTAPGTPAAARVGAELVTPLGGLGDLRAGPQFDMSLPDPLAASNQSLGPRPEVGFETGVAVGKGLSLDARTEYGLDGLGADSASGGVRAPRRSEIMMQYRIDW